MGWIECIGSEEQRGKLRPYVANIAVNLWCPDLLQQYITQINIPPISETDHKPTHVSGKNIIRHYKKQSLTIQAVQRQGTKLLIQRYQ